MWVYLDLSISTGAGARPYGEPFRSEVSQLGFAFGCIGFPVFFFIQ